MELGAHLLALLAPHRPGDEVEGGARLVGASTELGLRITFELGSRTVHVEIAPAEDGMPCAASSERLAFAYRSDDALDPREGEALCRMVAQLARGNEARVLAEIEAQAGQATAHVEDRARVREVSVERILRGVGRGPGSFYTLTPYVGCLVGCRFCYAQSRVGRVRRLQKLPLAPWGSYVDVRINAPEVLASELDRMPPRPIKFCPIVSDPYQASERRYRLTRRCLQAIRDADDPPPTLVLTRAASISDDLGLLAQIPVAYAGFSVPTVDDKVREHFEPRAASVSERLSILRKLRAVGVRPIAVVQPMMPGPVSALADALAEAVDSVSLDVLRGVEGAGEQFADPRYRDAVEDSWQRDRLAEVSSALEARGVAVWSGELPPELTPTL